MRNIIFSCIEKNHKTYNKWNIETESKFTIKPNKDKKKKTNLKLYLHESRGERENNGIKN